MKTYNCAKEVVQTLIDAGYLAYFAGGWVRDYIMEHPSDDIDIATDAPPEKIVKLFPKTVSVGIAFGVIVVLHKGHQFEVSTFRQDIGYEDGRRPQEIKLSTPFEDAQRRDFTINGMFFDPAHKKILDFVTGQKDIEHKIIRTIGEPHERFREDRLRMIRAVRFATRFGFDIEAQTQQAIIDFADTLFPAVAIERVWQELRKMAERPRFKEGILWLHQLGLLAQIFPQLGKVSMEELTADLRPLLHFPQKVPPILKLMAIFYDFPIDQKIELCRTLKISNVDLKTVIFAHHVEGLSERERVKDSEWVPIYANKLGQVCLEVVAARMDVEKRDTFLKEAALRKERLHQHIKRLKTKAPLVNSKHLKMEGIRPGKTMGLLLEQAQKIAVNEDLNDSSQVIALLKNSADWPKL